MPHEGQLAQEGRQKTGRNRVDVVILCGLVGLCAAALAAYAWVRPTRLPAEITYQQSGQLSYSSATGPGSIYGGVAVATGQPVYTATVPNLQVRYTYRFESSAMSRLAGTEQLLAKVQNGQGITRTLAIQGPTQFSSGRFHVSGTLPLSALTAIASSYDHAAGNISHGMYKVTIYPSVALHGHLGGLPFKASFAHGANFTYNTTVLAPTSAPGSGSTTAAAGAASTATQFKSAQPGSVKIPGGQPATLIGWPVLDVRVGALLLLAVALAGGLLVGLPLLRRATSEDERVRIETRFASSIIEAQALPVARQLVTVPLSSFTGLARVARQLECPILHYRDEPGDAYAVVDNGTIYSYRLQSGQPAPVGRFLGSGKDSGRHVASDHNEGVASPIRVS